MLSEERYEKIIEYVDASGTSTIKELSKLTGSSESTVRRDIQSLVDSGRLLKIYGGAKSVKRKVYTEELDMLKRHNLYWKEKEAIGQYAASLIKPDDFVFIDAGTTTEAIIEYLTEKNATYITNGLFNAQLLLAKGFPTHVVGGIIRPRTEAIVGEEAIRQILDCNFSISFFGTNGITVENGFTTPNLVEAAFKHEALKKSLKAYIVADPSKFGKIYPKTFGKIDEAEIITTELPETIYETKTRIKEVNKWFIL